MTMLCYVMFLCYVSFHYVTLCYVIDGSSSSSSLCFGHVQRCFDLLLTISLSVQSLCVPGLICLNSHASTLQLSSCDATLLFQLVHPRQVMLTHLSQVLRFSKLSEGTDNVSTIHHLAITYGGQTSRSIHHRLSHYPWHQHDLYVLKSGGDNANLWLSWQRRRHLSAWDHRITPCTCVLSDSPSNDPKGSQGIRAKAEAGVPT